MKVVRRIVLGIVAWVVVCVGFSSVALAATPIRLYLDQGSAFAILGHSCGGIQEKVYARGFVASGYPQGSVELETRCGGSGRGGGGGTTVYRGAASVVWTWFGETRSDGMLGAPLQAFEATDVYGDRVYNVGTAAYLETGAPPLQPPAAPTNVSASIALSEEPPEVLRMSVGWSVAPETARLLRYSTVTATPVGSGAPVLSASPGSYFSSAVLQPVEANTIYKVTVTSVDSEGVSESSAPIEIKSPNSDGEAEHEHRTTNACAINHGVIKLTPGLTEKPAVQSMSITGELSGCEGPAGFEAGKYTAHLTSTEEVSCSALSSASLEGTQAKTFSIKWLPAEEGTSKGSLILPLSEVALTGMTGSLTGGPFPATTSMQAASVTENFTGASTCGVPQGKNKTVKPVKAGTFSTSQVNFG